MKRIPALFPCLVALLITCALQTTRAAITDGLVAYWPLEQITADNTTPDVAFTNTMTVIGAPLVGAAQIGNGFTMSSSTYLTNMHAADNTQTGLPIYNAGAYSIAFWVKGAAQTAKYLFSEGGLLSNNPLLILQTGQQAANNAKFDVIIRNDAGTALINHIQSTNVVFDNNWHHIVWVDNRGQCKLYIDGAADPANFSYTPAGTFTFHSTAIGTLVRAAISTGATFTGQLDEVAVWERALSADDVTALKTSGLPNPVPPLGVVFTTQPASATKNLGDWALFSVGNYGIRPFSYQWYKNGNLIQDATNRSYQVTGLVPTNSGDFYFVKVTNPVGTVQTTNATLTVLADPAPDIRRDLVNYWPLNSIDLLGSDLVSTDLYSGNNMVLKGFVDTNDIVDGQFGKALAFDFVTKYTYRTNGTPIYSTTNYSVSMWVKAPFTSQNDRRVFSEGSSTSDNPLFTLGTDSANPPVGPSASVLVRGDNNVTVLARKSTRPVFDDNWHHIVWTDANGKAKLYIDGILDESDFNYTRPVSTLNRTSLGAVLRAVVANNTYYLGNIDEVATWKRALTFTEIQSIMTNGVPVPLDIIAPSIVTQPLNQTSGVFVGDTVNFNVTVTGTAPFTYEWYRNNTLIPVANNASAGTGTLVLTNVATGDSNTTYYVKITNGKGSVTSDTVTLNVAPYTPATNGTVLQVDVDLTGSPNLQPGFEEFNLGINGTNYNAVGLTITGIGASLAERLRTALVNNPPALTMAQIYNDFIFANSTVDGTGMRIAINRLAPNTKFAVTIWSWDSSSTTLRSSVWQETSDPNAPVDIANPYTFDGAVAPTSDMQYSFSGVVTSTAQGTLQIDGLRSGGNSFGVFLNALRLVANPTANISSVAINGNNLDINIQLLSADQVVSLQERASLTSGSWGPSSATQINQIGNVVTFETPINLNNQAMFYRVVAQ